MQLPPIEDPEVLRTVYWTACKAWEALNYFERKTRVPLTILQDLDLEQETLEQGTTSIVQIVEEVDWTQPIPIPFPYKNFRLRGWTIEIEHYTFDGFPEQDVLLYNQVFWTFYGRELKSLTLTHCAIPFNFTILPKDLWKLLPNLEHLTLTNCVMEMKTEKVSVARILILRKLRRDLKSLCSKPVKLRVLRLRNVTFKKAPFPIEWSGIMNMFPNLDRVFIRQRESKIMNLFGFLGMLANETIWRRPTTKQFILHCSGIMRWPKLESCGLTWNLWNWLTQVKLAKGVLQVRLSQTGFQGLKLFTWKSCPCRVLGVPEMRAVDEQKTTAGNNVVHPRKTLQQRMVEPTLRNCLHVVFEKAFGDGKENVDIFVRAINN